MYSHHVGPQANWLADSNNSTQHQCKLLPCNQLSQTAIDGLRRPVASITGFVETVAQTELTAEQRHYAEAIASAAAQLDELLYELGRATQATSLAGSGVEECPQEFGPAGCTVRAVLNQTVAAIAARAHERQIEIVADVAGDDDPVLIDESGLSDVLINLLSNAVDHSKGRRVRLLAVQVRRLHGPDTFRFAVSDDGGSLNPTETSRLFEASTDTCRGLPASQEWVNRHGGQIEVAVDPGTSTTFWFDIPVASVCDESAA